MREEARDWRCFSEMQMHDCYTIRCENRFHGTPFPVRPADFERAVVRKYRLRLPRVGWLLRWHDC